MELFKEVEETTNLSYGSPIEYIDSSDSSDN